LFLWDNKHIIMWFNFFKGHKKSSLPCGASSSSSYSAMPLWPSKETKQIFLVKDANSSLYRTLAILCPTLEKTFNEGCQRGYDLWTVRVSKPIIISLSQRMIKLSHHDIFMFFLERWNISHECQCMWDNN